MGPKSTNMDLHINRFLSHAGYAVTINEKAIIDYSFQLIINELKALSRRGIGSE